MALKIYTRTGDGGKTGLIGGTKVSKSHLRIESYGTVDELNSFIGLLNDLIQENEVNKLLREIQDRLFTIGSSLACDPDKEPRMKMPDLKQSDIDLLEQSIDKMNEELEPMKFFILPGGHTTISYAHICRTVCRRAERCCLRMQEEGFFVDTLVIKYLNRLSDYLFVLARFTGHKLQIAEIPWKPRV